MTRTRERRERPENWRCVAPTFRPIVLPGESAEEARELAAGIYGTDASNIKATPCAVPPEGSRAAFPFLPDQLRPHEGEVNLRRHDD